MPAAGTKCYITDQECPDLCTGFLEPITFKGKAIGNPVHFIYFVPLFLTKNSGNTGILVAKGDEKKDDPVKKKIQ